MYLSRRMKSQMFLGKREGNSGKAACSIFLGNIMMCRLTGISCIKRILANSNSSFTPLKMLKTSSNYPDIKSLWIFETETLFLEFSLFPFYQVSSKVGDEKECGVENK